MAVITGNSFDPNKRYVSVRLQQGVPLVDADWNELQDALMFATQAMARWFLGNGVPKANNGFQVNGTGLANDFVILSGVTGPADPLKNAGRCLVDGLEVFITADLNFTGQPLHESHGAAADTEAAKVGAPKITALATPLANGTVVAYLDVWERLVSPTEDAGLILPGLGVESCARTKREWAVRVRSGSSAPQASDGLPDYQPGHHYYALATIVRRNGDPLVNSADVSDVRQLRLTLADMEKRMSLLESLVLKPYFAASPNQFNPKIGIPGTNITLFGTNFNVSSPTVRFGGTPAAVVGTPTPTQIVATVPAVAPGPVTISVETIGGTTTSTDTFTVLPAPPPVPAPLFAASPNQFNPKLGVPTTLITLNGSNFNNAPQVVKFGTTPAAIVGVPTASTIQVRVPSMAPGLVTISVQTPGGTVVSTDTFTVLPAVPAPVFAASPNQFNPKLGVHLLTNVTLYGNNFNNAPVAVSFGATPATIVGAPTATQIVVTVPSMAAGATTITVSTAGGSVTSTDTFTVI